MKGLFRKKASYGKRQEYSVIAELLKKGFDVYPTLIDDQGIDCVIRINSKRYLDIQIKASSKDAIQPFKFRGIFVEPRDNFYFIFYVEKNNKFYIIPSNDFSKLWKKTKKNGAHKGKYNVVIRVKDKEFDLYNDFSILK